MVTLLTTEPPKHCSCFTNTCLNFFHEKVHKIKQTKQINYLNIHF